jgi:tagatose-6-phosphate ketose/aldose isomerase
MLQFEYLNSTQKENGIRGSLHTALEIAGQPELWQQVYDLVVEKKESLEKFLLPVMQEKNLRIILTGAGSSAFIGESVQGIFQAETKRLTQAIATTDLITHPDLYFMKEVPTLMISFARSGNSPESLEAINLANEHCETVFHLIVTCNESGQMIKNAVSKNYYCFILPDNANDKGLAMTGSFTSMLLSVMLIAKLGKLRKLQSQLSVSMENAGKLMGEYLPMIKEVASKKYDRVIFLGSGPLYGIARECHLKLQELTDGKVICKYDSFLGFRHGPRVVINEKSLIVYLFSNDDHVFQYEKDLVESIAADCVNLPSVSIGRKIGDLQNSVLDIGFDNLTVPSNYFYIIPIALIGQLLGFYQSLKLGLNPDNPSVSGAINRVVQGVTIYHK